MGVDMRFKVTTDEFESSIISNNNVGAFSEKTFKTMAAYTHIPEEQSRLFVECHYKSFIHEIPIWLTEYGMGVSNYD